MSKVFVLDSNKQPLQPCHPARARQLLDEKYTSQCSPYAQKVSKKYAKKSNRKQRGLYVDKKHNLAFNADSVGAFNILRKHLNKKLPPKGLSTPKKYIWVDVKFNVSASFN